MQPRSDTYLAVVLAVLLHVLLLLAAWWSARWERSQNSESAAGPVIEASLQFSAADIRRAQQAIKASAKPEQSPAPQPLPAPRPQTSDTPLQATPQAPQPVPDTVDQQREAPLADLQAQQKLAEQARQRQKQVDLTEDIQRQQEVERRQRLREQLEAIQQQRRQAEQLTHMEEQRLQQLADLSTPKPAKPTSQPSPPAGNNGQSKGLVAAYQAALHQTAEQNWNTSLAPERQRCQVRFTQIPGGEVINVEFMTCPYDAQARDSVERALRKSPMPYAGFESVFQRQITLTMCYPKEACEP